MKSSKSFAKKELSRKMRNPSSERGVTRASLYVFLIFCFLFYLELFIRLGGSTHHLGLWERLQGGIYIVTVSGLLYGAFVYMVSRYGYFKNIQRAISSSETIADYAKSESLNAMGVRENEEVLILIPSYKESHHVIRRTLLSAALQDYSRISIRLLLDDPLTAQSLEDDASRRQCIKTVQSIERLFDRFLVSIRKLKARHHTSLSNDLAECHAELMRAQLKLISEYPVDDNEDSFLLEYVCKARVQYHRSREDYWRSDVSGLQSSADLEVEATIETDYLENLYTIDIGYFERKAYCNLSHAPSKAMNINSYLSLLGRDFEEIRLRDGKSILVEKSDISDGEDEKLSFKRHEYIVTIDADTVIHPSYVGFLLSIICKNENSDVAVIQTPYSAFPNPKTKLERVAGATTDIQYIIHQGFHWNNAGFWVGANALMRFSAIESIAQDQPSDGSLSRVYISDATVIEDTESSIELANKGYRVFNHPERLAFSSTPPDYGALIIQRHRWANGGLVILPSAFRSLAKTVQSPDSYIFSALLRFHYLISISIVNIGLIILFVLPFADLESIWLPLTAVPYYFLYLRDLRQNGYGFRDLVRVYALNLLLIPVNIAGVLASIRQLVTGNKSPFRRTPKGGAGSDVPKRYVLFPVSIAIALIISGIIGLLRGTTISAAFSIVNGFLIVYALRGIARCRLRVAHEELNTFMPAELAQ